MSKARKKRRLSVFISWDNSLDINECLKSLRKDRLGVSQLIFDHLQYQMYVTNILKLKKGKDRQRKARLYFYPAVMSSDVGVIRDEAYIRIIRKLTAEEACKLLIFRYYNYLQPLPPETLVQLFNASHTKNRIVDVDRTNKTNIKINDHYKLQNVHWTKQQRKACANTRNFFLNQGRGVKEFPQLSDIPFSGNDEFFQEVLIAFLKAKVTPDIICKICESCFPMLDKSLDQPQDLKKQRLTVNPQRKSITIITDKMKRENKAASTIQRAFRQHLQTKMRAVRLIERWWYQLERERHQVISEIAEEMQEAFDRADLRVEDVFNWERFSQEIKDDYKTARHPEPRLPSYWFKVVAIVTLPILGAIEAVSPYHYTFIGINLPTLIFYIFLLSLIHYKHSWYATWIQTLGMCFFTVCILNQLFILRNGWIRVYAWIVIVAIGRQHWMAVLFVLMCIRVSLSLFYDIFAIQPVEYGIFVYDAYCVTTIAAASRQGTPIQMLQKVMINIVMLVIIAAGGAVTLVVACLHLDY